MRCCSLNLWLALAAFFLAGCREKLSEAPAVGAYGVVTNLPDVANAPARVDGSGAHPWTNAQLAVIESRLSPASLCFSKSTALSFFSGLAANGIDGPAFIAISTEQGPKIFKPGDRIDPARLRESWFVAWFAGARGWTNWDSPWFLTLQRRPTTIRLDTNGLHLSFRGEAGYAALMPLYGVYKPLPAGAETSPFATLKEKKKRVLTWEWHKALPADPLARARYWASALREFPISCEETFSVDRAHDSITIGQSFRWLSWNDDWNTRPLKLAPISPVLAHAVRQSFPADFSAKPYDMEIFTEFGPYYGVQEVDSYRVTLPVLRYVHETAGAGESIAGKLEAPCFLAWQEAHQSLDWEALRLRWPALRDEFLGRASTDWPAFASAHGRPPLEQVADAVGAARIAYRLRDMGAYVKSVHFFARALVQLSVQQRGLDYFREHQPWRSMEPLPADATLAVMEAQGWTTGTRTPSALVMGVPDLARILRDTAPASTERRTEPVAKLERLIPGSAATPFLWHDLAVTNSSGGLVHTISTGSAGRGARGSNWPRIVWPGWKTGEGEPWSFGEISSSKTVRAKPETIEINANNRAVIIHAP